VTIAKTAWNSCGKAYGLSRGSVCGVRGSGDGVAEERKKVAVVTEDRALGTVKAN